MIRRSPTRSDPNIERSESQPNLSTSNVLKLRETAGPASTMFRHKRKHGDEDEVNLKLSDIQNQMIEMMALLTTSINAQNESSAKISGDIADIKDQIIDIKKSMGMTGQKLSNLAIEQTGMKAEIQNLADTVYKTDEKIATLESDVQKLQVSSTGSILRDLAPCDDVMYELNDQINRKNNILIMGVKEPKSDSIDERKIYDKGEVLKTIKLISVNCPEPTQIARIGKYKSDGSRAIKVRFESEETAKQILKNKSKLAGTTIKIFGDQTPYQQTRFKKLKDELNHRTLGGEKNLLLKYIKGVPKIVTAPAKN